MLFVWCVGIMRVLKLCCTRPGCHWDTQSTNWRLLMAF